MKRIFIVCALALMLCLSMTGCGGDTLTLNVYNWGEYIAEGNEGSLDTVKAFESWYKETYGEKVTVNYSTYASNEDMYNKISSNAVSYDVIFPSDYMIERMLNEDLLQPINFDNIPNYRYINDAFKGLYYDPENLYTVPYCFGTVGIVYDANVVDKADTGGWDLLWNDKYKGSILQFNNPRDAFATAMYKLGIDVNTNNKAEWDRAYEELINQRPLVYSYVMDEVFNMMEAGEASVCTYYSGDYFLMRDAQAEGIDLQFYYPEPTNYFVDAMCIPKNAQNKELAEIFINFLLSEEPAIEDAVVISYATPNSLVYENDKYIEMMGQDVVDLMYPDFDTFRDDYNKYAYHNLDSGTLEYLNSLWEGVKIN